MRETGAPVSPSLIDYGPEASTNAMVSHTCPAMAHESHPAVAWACVDHSHFSTLVAWSTVHTLSACEEEPIPHLEPHSPNDSIPGDEDTWPMDFGQLPPTSPFTIAVADASTSFKDTLPISPHHSVPIMILGMSLNGNAASQLSAVSHLNPMADSGANVCLTPDPTLLVNITDIPPVPLGVALSHLDDTGAVCRQQGYLPIPLLDGTFHYQPFLINPNATDTILSPAHVMKSSAKF